MRRLLTSRGTDTDIVYPSTDIVYCRVFDEQKCSVTMIDSHFSQVFCTKNTNADNISIM